MFENLKVQQRAQNRRAFQIAADQLPVDIRPEFQTRYVQMCREVARKSAEMFNERFKAAMNGNTKSAVLKSIARFFFRINLTDYIFAGLERANEFAVLIADLTKWKRDWPIRQNRGKA